MSELDPATIWPLGALAVRTPDVELRYPDDDDLLALARVAADGIHAPDQMPVTTPWTVGEPLAVARNVLQWQWAQRARVGAEQFALELAVVHDGELVGIQSVSASRFAVLRTVETGSWLGRRFQGRGIGTAMRLAVLHLAFDALGAQVAESSAFATNPASIAVSRRLGYADNGVATALRGDGQATLQRRYRFTREMWERRPSDLRPEVTFEGLDGVREILGIESVEPAEAAEPAEPMEPARRGEPAERGEA